ncbi:MAG: hypothetical protein HKO57_13090, partial [Akkermansiaceae bacterium]|nr:hypothetical protein [Akkermansiaceae bacterium]
MRRILTLPVLLALLAPALPGAVRTVVIGDSQSEEYAFELPFSAPDSDPLIANTRNWIEILAAQRPAGLDFGGYSGIPLSYPDLRNGGFARNFGVPAAESGTWEDIVQSSLFDSPEFFTTRLALEDQLSDAEVVVLFLGGNDVNSTYGSLYDDTISPGFFTGTRDRFAAVFTFIRSERPAIPIVFVNIPDVGASPDVQADHPDPAKRAVASHHIASLNALLGVLAASHAATVVDLFAFTAQLLDPAPVYLGAIEMIRAGAPENPPDHLFCKDGFHPSTSAQAVVANVILEGVNAAVGTAIPLLPSREILEDQLGLDPDQPYLDWLAAFPGASAAMTADDDGDGLPQVGEFALQHDPLRADGLSRPASRDGTAVFTYHPDPAANRLVESRPECSTD